MEKDPKDSKDPKGDPKDDPKGDQNPDVQALKKKLTERDSELKKAQADLEELKNKNNSEDKNEVEKLTKTVVELTEKISNITSENEKEKLQEKYPDIVPELLQGRSEEEQEAIVKRQRDKIAENYNIKPSDHEPQYTERGAFEKEATRIREDRTLDTDTKLQKIRELKLRKGF